MHFPTLAFLALTAICALSWLGAGLALPTRCISTDALLGWLTRIAFGSVVVSLLVLGIGRVGELGRPLLIGLTLLGAGAGSFALPSLARSLYRAPLGGRFVRLLLGLVGLALLLDLVASTAPPTSADALKYHLALPRLWLETGSIGDPFWRWEGFNPSGIEMLYTQGLALGGGSAAAPIHAVLGILCALAVYGLGRELGGQLAGAVASFLFVLQGIVTWEATSAFIELGLAFYVVLAVWYATRWSYAPGRLEAGWAGFFSGAAAGTKYIGLGPAAIVVGFVAVVALKRRRTVDLMLASGATVVAGGAWYVKNAIVAGNPVYPLVLGGKWLTPFADHAIRDLVAYGVGGGLARLALLPVDLLLHGSAFDRGQYIGTGIFLFALLALFTTRTHAVVVLWVGSGVYIIAWWEGSPQARFLLPALGVLAAVGGAGVTPWLRSRDRRRAAIVVILCGITVAWLAASLALTRQLLPVTVGAESRGVFLQRLTGTYDAFRQVRTRVGSGTVGIANYQFTYNFPGRAVTIDVPEFQPSVPRSIYLARLRSLGVSSILVGGALADSPTLAPIRGCLTREGIYHARFVTSRSLGQSIPYELVLYSLVRCGA